MTTIPEPEPGGPRPPAGRGGCCDTSTAAGGGVPAGTPAPAAAGTGTDAWPAPTAAPGGGPGRDPLTGQPFADLRRTRRGDYEVTVSPGADPFDLARVLVTVPSEAVFTEAFGDVETVLVFRTATAGNSPAPAPAPAPDGWIPALAVAAP